MQSGHDKNKQSTINQKNQRQKPSHKTRAGLGHESNEKRLRQIFEFFDILSQYHPLSGYFSINSIVKFGLFETHSHSHG